jgi:hypothetical protein
VKAQLRLLFIAMLGLWALSGCGSSMTSYWKFDEGEGTTAHDSIGTNHGEIYGAIWATGISKTSLSFDGSDDYVQSTLNIDQGGSTDITMVAWVYPTSTNSGRHQVISTDNGGFDWGILIEDGKWHAFTGDGSWDSGFTVDLNMWQHIAAVFKPDEDVIFYKNAVSRLRGSAPDTDVNDINIAIGNNPGPWDEYFQGKIDEAAIYNSALSAEEIEQFYQDGADNAGTSCKAFRISDREMNEIAKIVLEKIKAQTRSRARNQRAKAEIEKITAEAQKLRKEAEKVDVETQKLREEIRLLRARTRKLEAAEKAKQEARKARAETEQLKNKSKTKTENTGVEQVKGDEAKVGESSKSGN